MERKAPNTNKCKSLTRRSEKESDDAENERYQRADGVSRREGLILSGYYAEKSQAYRVEVRKGVGHFGNVTGKLVVGLDVCPVSVKHKSNEAGCTSHQSSVAVTGPHMPSIKDVLLCIVAISIGKRKGARTPPISYSGTTTYDPSWRRNVKPEKKIPARDYI